MALCSSGSMSLGGSSTGRSVNCELGCSGTASINMNRADVRDLAERSSGCIRMSDFYGKSSAPSSLGESYEGGFYMGTISAAGSCYYLIVAPNSTGCACCQWKTTDSSTSGTGSGTDGYDNTYPSLENSSHPAGNWTATRTIGGFSDWYLPAIDELQVFYDNGGGAGAGDPLPAGEDFVSTNYWSSSEYLSFALLACLLPFTTGSRTSNLKTTSDRVRAVRREPI